MVREGGFQPTDVFANPAAVAKYAEKDKNDRQRGVLSLCQSLLKPSGHGFEFSPMGTELDIPYIPSSLRHGLLGTAGFLHSKQTTW